MQQGLSLGLPDGCTINACASELLKEHPVYLTLEVKSSLSNATPMSQLARWATWSRLNEVRTGIDGDHLVLPAIAVQGHLWTLYLHSYDPIDRKLVRDPLGLADEGADAR